MLTSYVLALHIVVSNLQNWIWSSHYSCSICLAIASVISASVFLYFIVSLSLICDGPANYFFNTWSSDLPWIIWCMILAYTERNNWFCSTALRDWEIQSLFYEFSRDHIILIVLGCKDELLQSSSAFNMPNLWFSTCGSMPWSTVSNALIWSIKMIARMCCLLKMYCIFWGGWGGGRVGAGEVRLPPLPCSPETQPWCVILRCKAVSHQKLFFFADFNEPEEIVSFSMRNQLL